MGTTTGTTETTPPARSPEPALPGETGDRWHFGGPVPAAFDEPVRRSVPLYDEGHRLILELSDFFLNVGSGRVVDLGCSTGTLLSGLAARHDGRGMSFLGVDSEPDMVAHAADRCADDARIAIRHASATDPDCFTADRSPDDLRRPPQTRETKRANKSETAAGADLIVSYYTMQFVPPRQRQQVFDRIYQSLNWGGALVLFEKVRAPDARFQDMATQLYQEFKQRQGYRSEEILAKSRALKGVLEPFSTQGNLDLMRRAGVEDITSVRKYVCFEGFLAIK